jgi:hypothetical protein
MLAPFSSDTGLSGGVSTLAITDDTSPPFACFRMEMSWAWSEAGRRRARRRPLTMLSMQYKRALRFRGWQLNMAPPPLRYAVRGSAPLRRR